VCDKLPIQSQPPTAPRYTNELSQKSDTDTRVLSCRILKYVDSK